MASVMSARECLRSLWNLPLAVWRSFGEPDACGAEVSPSAVPIGAVLPDGSVSSHRWKDSPEPMSSHRNCSLQKKRESSSSCLWP